MEDVWTKSKLLIAIILSVITLIAYIGAKSPKGEEESINSPVSAEYAENHD